MRVTLWHDDTKYAPSISVYDQDGDVHLLVEWPMPPGAGAAGTETGAVNTIDIVMTKDYTDALVDALKRSHAKVETDRLYSLIGRKGYESGTNLEP